MKFNRRAIRMVLPVFLTQFAFGRKISYICNSGAGLPCGKSRFFYVFQAFSSDFSSYFSPKIPVLEF